MEIYQIRTFVTVAEHGNLTKAALAAMENVVRKIWLDGSAQYRAENA